MKTALLALTIVFFIIPTLIIAQPAIDNISGVVGNKQQVVLNGSGFGDMGGEIVSWDDFDGHTVNTPIHNSQAIIGPNWTCQYSYNDLGARFDNTRSHSGDLAAHIDWGHDPAYGIRAFGWGGQGPFSQLYITYWRYMEGDYDPTLTPAPNHKQFYLFGNNGGMPSGMPLIPAQNSKWGYYINVSTAQTDPYGRGNWNGTSNMNTKEWNYDNTKDKFQRWEFWQKLNTPWDCTENVDCNGELKYWLDGELGFERSDYRHRFVDGEYKEFELGHMAGKFESTAKAWFDDLYIATTQARVELGNAATWNACTHREIQIPSSWSPSAINIDMNLGNFDGEDEVYLYVVDKDGNVNENGYPIEIAVAVDDEEEDDVDPITGTLEMSGNAEITLFPNPSTDELVVQGLSSNAEVIIRSISGKKLIGSKLNKATGTHRIDITKIPKGVYIVEIHTAKGKYSEKFVKQ